MRTSRWVGQSAQGPRAPRSPSWGTGWAERVDVVCTTAPAELELLNSRCGHGLCEWYEVFELEE